MAHITMREAISQALWEEMERDPSVFIMGEEVGVWGGSYAVTRGFYDHFGGERVRDTPIAEAGIIGAAIGAALVGERPVAELMTINFAFAAMDHIVNEAAKLHYMFAGQFKLPLLREELVSDTFQLAANRSVLNSVFTQSRSQGVQLSNQWDQFRLFAAFSDGLKTVNTDYTSTGEADYAGTIRGDWKWAGDWKQATDFTSFRGSPYFGMLGGAAHYQSGGDTFATMDVQLFEATVDLSVEGDGWNAYGAGIYRHADPVSGSAIDDWGFMVQGGFFVSPQCELFARYDVVIPDSSRATSDNMNTLTFGLNHYFIPESHALKFTFDVEFFLDKQDRGIAPSSTLTGLLGSDKSDQWNLRAQMQLMF